MISIVWTTHQYDGAKVIVESVEKGKRLFHPYHNQGYYYCRDEIYIFLYERKKSIRKFSVRRVLDFFVTNCCIL
jgi:hypothetical protein